MDENIGNYTVGYYGLIANPKNFDIKSINQISDLKV